ncbi:MAG: ABC transporter permease, partial [Rheinheimera sp.]
MPKHSALMITAVRTSVRSFSAQWLHLLLNISGLVVGMAAALLILMFVRYELSFDQQHPADENSYRLEQWFVPIAQRFPISSPAMKQLLVQYHPDITVSRFHTSSLKVTPAGQLSPRQMSLQAPMAVEANFTDFFRIDTLQGDLAQVLQQPGLIALSQSEANRLFGAQNALGQLLQLADSSLKVAAIYADLPENTHLVAGSLRRIADSELATSLAINNVYSYVQLPVSVVIADLEQYLTKALKEQGYEGQEIATIQLRAFHDIHLHSALAHELKPNGSIRSVQLAFALACLILLIVAINFINISTARASSRAREVGVRKTLGASRLQLISQFLLESVLICALAGALAIIVAVLCLPYFNLLVGRQIGLDWAQLAGLQSMLVLLMGLAAGMYPAFYLSAFDAKRVLSGDFQRGGTAIWLRKALLVLQGMISIALIIATLIIQQQLQLLHNAPTGYDRSNTLMAEAIPQAQILQQDNALV